TFDLGDLSDQADMPLEVEPVEPDLSSLMALTEDEISPSTEPVVEVELLDDALVAPDFAPEPEPAPVSAQDSFEEAPGLSFAALAEEIMPSAPAPAPKPVAPPAAKALPASGDGDDNHRSVGVQSIRVDLDKVDRVVNMVGELVITQS